jgi:CheY-like chemotaxis protein
MKRQIMVLIVDDQPEWREALKEKFLAKSEVDYPYSFEVECAADAEECIDAVRKKKYDVIVLDVKLGSGMNGLEVSFGLEQLLGFATPIRIILTGNPDYQDCVESMRHGAWDYIVKQNTESKLASVAVVDSVEARLRHVDVLKEQEQLIAIEWLPRNIEALQAQYGGQVVAIWHQPEVNVVAHGTDAFRLEAVLKEWRSSHQPWERPFLVRIPSKPG